MSSEKEAEKHSKKSPKSLMEMTRTEAFDCMARDPSTWLWQGMGLMRAAYVLWSFWQTRFDEIKKRPSGSIGPKEHCDLTTDRFVSSYMLLAGYGIENAVKGLLVLREGHKTETGKLLNGMNNHDLCKFLHRTGISLNDGERLLVKRLTDLILWRGRYGTPVSETRLSAHKPGMSYGVYFHHPEEITKLFLRVVSEYRDDYGQWTAWMLEECPKPK